MCQPFSAGLVFLNIDALPSARYKSNKQRQSSLPTRSETLSCWLDIIPCPSTPQLLPGCAKVTELSQAVGRKIHEPFSTWLGWEGGHTKRIIFAFPMQLLFGKQRFTVGLTFARVPEDTTETFTVHSSSSQAGPSPCRPTKVTVQQLHGSFTWAHTNTYTGAASMQPG